MHTWRGRRRRGFTLIELLVVIVIIAILALLVIGRLLGAARRAREARLRDDLREIRGAVERFYGDTGVFPAALTDLVVNDTAKLSSELSDTTKSLYRGPYLRATGSIAIPDYPGIPPNPFVSQLDGNIANHWTYETTTGNVWSAVDAVSLSGVPYTEM